MSLSSFKGYFEGFFFGRTHCQEASFQKKFFVSDVVGFESCSERRKTQAKVTDYSDQS